MSSYIFFPTNEYSDSTKSEEQIRQLIVEDLGSCEKNMIFLLTKGHPLQKPYVYRNFPVAWRELLPYVLNLLPNENSDNQILAADSLLELANGSYGALSEEDIQRIFQTCVKCLYLWNWTVNEKCVKVIEVLLREHPQRRTLIDQLEKIVAELGRSNQPIVSKVTAGRIIAVIFQDCSRKSRVSMIDILKSILAHPESEARRIWLTEIFPKLLRNAETTIIETHLQQKLFQAVYDKNEEIGLCALDVILTHCQFFSQEEKSSRIVKLFVDSIISKHERVTVMTSKLLGVTYQKLQDVILQNQQTCLKFWQTLIELSQSKNPIILNNFMQNLPGILVLSKPKYNVQPISQIYIELFYQNLASKFQLAACFHVMIEVFPAKRSQFRDIIFNMFEEVLDQEEECDEGFKVLDIILEKFALVAKQLFMDGGEQPYLEENITKCLLNYCAKLEKKRNSTHLQNFFLSFNTYIHLISSEQLQSKFIPKFYASLKLNLPLSSKIVNTLLMCLAREVANSSLITSFFSKVAIELGKSPRSFERRTALQFFGNTINYFSVQLFQEFKMAEKILNFSNDRDVGVKLLLVKLLPHCQYYFLKEEKVDCKNALSKMSAADQFIKKFIQEAFPRQFEENEAKKAEIDAKSAAMRELQKARLANAQAHKRVFTRKDLFKDLKYMKEDASKKKPLVTESNILPRLKPQRMSIDKTKTTSSRLSGTSLKVGSKRA